MRNSMLTNVALSRLLAAAGASRDRAGSDVTFHLYAPARAFSVPEVRSRT
jgi:hypothetical protein